MTNSSPRNVRRRVLGQYGRVQKFVLGTSYTFMYNDQPKIMASIQACPDTLLIQSSPERPAGKQSTNRASLYRDADATARVSTRNGRDQSTALPFHLGPLIENAVGAEQPRVFCEVRGS